MKSIITCTALAVGAAIVLVRAYQAKQRDDLAATALHALLARGSHQSLESIQRGKGHFDAFSEDAYKYADAMRKARK